MSVPFKINHASDFASVCPKSTTKIQLAKMEQPNLTILHKVSISGNDPINFILADNSTSTIGFLASKNVRHPSMYGMWDGPSSVSREGLG